jgi:dTDP-D-glucose 4,6-dehydratase
MPKKVLFTGHGGFVGHHCLEYFLNHTDWELICIDSFRHKGTCRRVVEISPNNPRVKTFIHDLAVPIDHQLENLIFERQINERGIVIEKPVHMIINMASESAVERSTTEPVGCLHNNWHLGVNMLEFARKCKGLTHYFLISTDEVYGEAPANSAHKEWDPILPSNPYASSKAAMEAVAIAYWRTYGVPVVISNCYDMNTKVFTPKGSKTYDEIQEGDMVWTLDENENLIQEPVLKKIRMPHQGHMVQVTSNKVDQCVTPNHRMMIKRCQGKPRRWGNIEETYAENLVDMKGRIRIPTCGKWEKKHQKFIETDTLIDQSQFHFNAHKLPSKLRSDWVADILGWYVSEGLTGSGAICWGAASESQQQEIRELLDEINIHNYLGTHKRSVVCSNKGLETLVKQCGHLAKNKRIPDWAMNQSKQFLERLFVAAIKGDGSYLKVQSGHITAVYYTKSKSLAEQMSEVGIKLGMSARICKRKTWNPKKAKKSESYIVRFRRPQADIEKRNVSTVPYDGEIWCISVPSGRVFIERNGKISLSGQTMNIVGERQDPEKFLPKIIQKIALGEEMPIYGDNPQNIGSRIYLHAKNMADALVFLSKNPATQYKDLVASGHTGDSRPDRYNICGDTELNNLELAQMVADIMHRELKYRLIPSESARPGYDRRYALDGSKLAKLGWKAPLSFQESLELVVNWTLENPHWLI